MSIEYKIKEARILMRQEIRKYKASKHLDFILEAKRLEGYIQALEEYTKENKGGSTLASLKYHNLKDLLN